MEFHQEVRHSIQLSMQVYTCIYITCAHAKEVEQILAWTVLCHICTVTCTRLANCVAISSDGWREQWSGFHYTRPIWEKQAPCSGCQPGGSLTNHQYLTVIGHFLSIMFVRVVATGSQLEVYAMLCLGSGTNYLELNSEWHFKHDRDLISSWEVMIMSKSYIHQVMDW